ncbi:hypothetical protein [Halobellus ruber]|uniref:Restriction endonuclease n=1 Tax=Halobellus ruber TaxID=2761102 RepID=A0A7J9SJ66_9EURY|nr:hypothetical protein [Halobellus ruber]MBB6645051.1 hypothetical protein [Halobellus ruber]
MDRLRTLAEKLDIGIEKLAEAIRARLRSSDSETDSDTDTDSEADAETADRATRFESALGSLREKLSNLASFIRRHPLLTGGGVVLLLLAARRTGIDRYAEARQVERLNAKEYARHVGGTVTDSGTSAYAPDGGVDGVVRVGEDQTKIQSKHHATAVPESVLQEYADTVDVVAASNGFADGVDPATYGFETFTTQDWSLLAQARLECGRILRGLSKWVRGVRACLTTIVESRGHLDAIASFVRGLRNPQLAALAAIVSVSLWFSYKIA